MVGNYMDTSNKEIWESIHASRNWGRWPDALAVQFMGKNFFHLSREQRSQVSVLDLGYGQGANTWFVIREGFEVFGIDLSCSAQGKLKSRLIDEGLLPEEFDQKFKVGSMVELPFEDASFDAAIDFESMSCLDINGHEKAYHELWRVLKPGGLVYIHHILKDSWGFDPRVCSSDGTMENVSEGPFQNLGNIYFANYCDLVTMLESVGFLIVEQEKITKTYLNMEKEIQYANLTVKRPR
jgi:SAM-dependent methyltransferase